MGTSSKQENSCVDHNTLREFSLRFWYPYPSWTVTGNIYSEVVAAVALRSYSASPRRNEKISASRRKKASFRHCPAPKTVGVPSHVMVWLVLSPMKGSHASSVQLPIGWLFKSSSSTRIEPPVRHLALTIKRSPVDITGRVIT